ncbi:hypothetical protein Tco_0844428 [Tanacetum coccineum]
MDGRDRPFFAQCKIRPKTTKELTVSQEDKVRDKINADKFVQVKNYGGKKQQFKEGNQLYKEGRKNDTDNAKKSMGSLNKNNGRIANKKVHVKNKTSNGNQFAVFENMEDGLGDELNNDQRMEVEFFINLKL